ncbi:hypothetical protein D9M72_570470 [compost metagenome]
MHQFLKGALRGESVPLHQDPLRTVGGVPAVQGRGNHFREAARSVGTLNVVQQRGCGNRKFFQRQGRGIIESPG